MAKAALNVVLVTALLIALVIGIYLNVSWQVCVIVVLVAAILGVGIRLIVRWRQRAKYPIGVETRFTPADTTANEAEVVELDRRPQADFLAPLPTFADGADAGGNVRPPIPTFLRPQCVDLNAPLPSEPPNFFSRFDSRDPREGDSAPVEVIPPESQQPPAGPKEPTGTANGPDDRQRRGENRGRRFQRNPAGGSKDPGKYTG